jgi:hypothetical protein
LTYAVVWPDAAIDRLALAYLAARRDDRGEAFRRAVDALEAHLAADPSELGESRPGEARIVHRLPAGLRFRVDETARFVVVLDVIYVGR